MRTFAILASLVVFCTAFSTADSITITTGHGASVITSKAAIHDQFKTGHTLEAVQDIGCSILPPVAEASLFLCANCVGRISERGHDAAGDRAWR